MAQLVTQQDGSILLSLNPIEQDTYSGLPDGQLSEYVSLWLAERSKQVFQDRFALLPPEDQFTILTKFRDVVKPKPEPAPPAPVEVPIV